MDPENRWKWVDDLSIIEIVNWISIGMPSFNMKCQIPNDIPIHNQYIDPQNLKSQQYLNSINEWTNKQKMKLNKPKSKVMIFHFANNYKFTTRLSLDNEHLEVIKKIKLLGTIITDNLKWDDNTKELEKEPIQEFRF